MEHDIVSLKNCFLLVRANSEGCCLEEAQGETANFRACNWMETNEGKRLFVTFLSKSFVNANHELFPGAC